MADLLKMSATNYAYIEQGKVKVNVDKLEEIAKVLDTDIFELLALGESNVVYVQSTNNDETNNNQSAYIINNSLPSDYQNLLIKSERLEVENKFY
ncbi:MAG: hypothetical protein COZ18_10535 [Flexibacter sp. CG_4_10_14_3_um_filter_32_15]|nr:MAG: hypothetical protein COZ18_10535 [Flexibacter sp. CG_4_10_14_3_um_filter_32_15]